MQTAHILSIFCAGFTYKWLKSLKQTLKIGQSLVSLTSTFVNIILAIYILCRWAVVSVNLSTRVPSQISCVRVNCIQVRGMKVAKEGLRRRLFKVRQWSVLCLTWGSPLLKSKRLFLDRKGIILKMTFNKRQPHGLCTHLTASTVGERHQRMTIDTSWKK